MKTKLLVANRYVHNITSVKAFKFQNKKINLRPEAQYHLGRKIRVS